MTIVREENISQQLEIHKNVVRAKPHAPDLLLPRVKALAEAIIMLGLNMKFCGRVEPRQSLFPFSARAMSLTKYER
jgi:hypothetical protein